MHDLTALLQERIFRQYHERIVPARYRTLAPARVEAWEAPGEPVPFADAVAQDFAPFPPGAAWGRPWGTTWLRITGEVPADWPAGAPVELVVDLGFSASQPGFQAEGLYWDESGRILKGLEPRNTHLALTGGPGASFTVYVEAASNPDVAGPWHFQPTPLGDVETAPAEPIYRFQHAAVGLLDVAAFGLERDVWVLDGLARELPPSSPRRAGILRALERALDVLDPEDVPGTAAAARAELSGALAATNGSTGHRVAAVGHAHIDSAWLWPVRETRRKVARTWSNVLDLMAVYPDLVFAASSAVQYSWIKEDYPELFERLRAAIADGRFVPVGGMWVESDTNLPGGEAMARQFVAGKGFFLREFGIETDEVWLPDSFGYSGALPQIVAASNSSNFLTQKISWNETNRFPHHSFDWEGIDGTRVLTHFPPVDTYNSELTPAELARAERQHSERGVSDLSLVPFGFGDGGGGPTREMVEAAHRQGDLDGSPRVSVQRPDAFFAELRESLPHPPVWSGELYLEFHRGTYTSQARTKHGNRRAEHLLREAELWAATAAVRAGSAYPADELRRAWESVLLNQFHDILPGSSIAWVYRVAEREYAAVTQAAEQVIADALAALGAGAGAETQVAFNASPFPVAGVPALGAGAAARASGTATSDGDGFVLESAALRARIDGSGALVSLVDLATGREAIAPGARGNELQLFRDTPNKWDAWDIDRAYQRMPMEGIRATGVHLSGERIEAHYALGASTAVQRIGLAPDGRALEIETEVDWHERQKLLKLAFAFDVHADTAASEIQFGHIRRPTHQNTSWDVARFETVAHRWLRVDEPGFGVTLANDRVYGHDVSRIARDGGGTTTLVRESLLRAPLFPDPDADQGRHVFRHAISLGSLLDGVAEGYRVNLPLRRVPGAPVDPLVRVEGSDAIAIEAVKLAEDGSGDVVVRLYEVQGGRAIGRLIPGFDAGAAVRVDLLERPWPDQPADARELRLRPFELITVRIPRS
ncbi:MAG: alpha-mannosidase [Micrococcales bacterium]|nr:alpha-mannosidase [Micrococcales bacterium]